MHPCRIVIRQRKGNSNFYNNILFTGGACSHAIKVKYFENEFTIIVWAGIVGDHSIGLVTLLQRLPKELFLQHLQNTLTKFVKRFTFKRDMWFIYDGASSHFSVNHLN